MVASEPSPDEEAQAWNEMARRLRRDPAELAMERAVALLCGWEEYITPRGERFCGWYPPAHCETDSGWRKYPPEYCLDRNALPEILTILEKQQLYFTDELPVFDTGFDFRIIAWRVLNLPPRAIVTAALKTLGAWQTEWEAGNGK